MNMHKARAEQRVMSARIGKTAIGLNMKCEGALAVGRLKGPRRARRGLETLQGDEWRRRKTAHRRNGHETTQP